MWNQFGMWKKISSEFYSLKVAAEFAVKQGDNGCNVKLSGHKKLSLIIDI